MRRPWWAGDAFTIKVNGTPIEAPPVNNGKGNAREDGPYYYAAPLSAWVPIERTWKTGDVVEVSMPKTLRLERTPDMPGRTAIMWGPLVLAGDIGPEPQRGRGRQGPPPQRPISPVFITADKPLEEWLEPIPGKPGHYRTAAGATVEPTAEAKPRQVELMPFYQNQERSYTVYWDTYTPDEWSKKHTEYVAEAKHEAMLDAASVATVPVFSFRRGGDFNFQGGRDSRRPVRVNERFGRTARSWFSYDVPVDPSHPMALVVTYNSGKSMYESAGRGAQADSFEIQVDGANIAHASIAPSDPTRFYDVTYPIPADLVKGKQKVTVRFQADEGSRVRPVFGLRMVRADDLK